MRAAAIFVAVGALVGVFASIALGVLREDGRRAAELLIEPTEPGPSSQADNPEIACANVEPE